MQTTELLYEQYSRHMRQPLGSAAFSEYIGRELDGCGCISIGGGLLHYSLRQENGKAVCVLPLCGYYAQSEKTAVRLFQKLADTVPGSCPCTFYANLYSDDAPCIQAYHMMQFGTLTETCAAALPLQTKNAGFAIRTLSAEETEARWPEVWAMTYEIIRHLQKSPVFYPGKEFTEDLYRGFFLDADTHVIAAEEAGRFIGMIEWNGEENPLLCGEHRSVNVGEVYVLPERRGTGLAEALLDHAQREARNAGAQAMWVEHGTANPNARGFWNRYFPTCQYQLTRTIEPV